MKRRGIRPLNKYEKNCYEIISLLVALFALSFGGCVCKHDYEWVSDDTTHVMECKHCGERQEESVGVHEAEEVQAKRPTYIKEGNEMGIICSICRRILEGCKIIPASTPFRGKSFGDLNYCEYMPEIKAEKKVPLILYLHGAGERGNNNESQLKHTINKVIFHGSPSKFMDAVVIAPQCPSKLFWTNADHANGVYNLSQSPETEILKKVMSLVREYLSYDYIDKDRVYVVGLSMGGYATWELAARYPDVFAAAVPICGGGPIDQINVLKEMPVYAFHGKMDPLVPYKGSKDMVDAILEAGGEKVIFKTFENGYHDIWDKSIVYEGDEHVPALAEWLFSQSK